MPEQTSRPTVRISDDQVTYLIATAARAPSVHNTQPWRFRAGDGTIDLYADPRRRLHVDKDGREMLISCRFYNVSIALWIYLIIILYSSKYLLTSLNVRIY